MSISVQRTRRRQQREETRRQILDAAIEFLRERPYRELSVDALMARTGHTRTLFYRHFDDVPSLILALIQDVGAELVQTAQEWAAVEEVGPGVARRRLAAFVDFHTRNAGLVAATVEASHHDDAVQKAYEAMVEGFVALTARAISARTETGELAPLDEPEIARALIRMLNGYLCDPRRTDDPERALEAITTIWARTLFPDGNRRRGQQRGRPAKNS
jgi:AcrR family transcriptional regulator